jgi:hypothetical protein
MAWLRCWSRQYQLAAEGRLSNEFVRQDLTIVAHEIALHPSEFGGYKDSQSAGRLILILTNQAFLTIET